MKHLSRLFTLLVLVSAALFFTNCGGDGGGSEETPEQKQLALLAGTWTITDAKLNGTTDKPEFDGSTLTITTGKAFTFDANATIAAGPWPSSGSFEFGSNITTQMTIIHTNGDSFPATYAVSATDLTITIANYDGEAYAHSGRVESVEGTWSFTLEK